MKRDQQGERVSRTAINSIIPILRVLTDAEIGS